MKIGEIVDNFKVPPHPSNIILEGNLVRLEPLKADKHSVHLFESNAMDKEKINWTYLPYGPFETVEKYADWIKEFENGNDPVFFAIIRKSDSKPVGIASYLRIKPNDGSIEVSAFGGVSPYSWQWDITQSTTIIDTFPLVDTLQVGTYTVTVTDTVGCQGVAADIEITQPDPLQLLDTVIQDVSCNGWITNPANCPAFLVQNDVNDKPNNQK